MFATLAHLARLTRAAVTLARHDAILPAEYQEKLPAAARVASRGLRLIARRDRADNPGERLARALESLGPSYVKFGQVLATRGDVVGERFARGLSRLQDRMPPFDHAKAVRTVETELGRPLDQLFTEFGPAIAAASIAQVHKAVTTEGDTVAVKVLRPGIEIRLAHDIAAMRLGAKLVESLFPDSRRLEPVKFVETVARATEMEMDLRLEGASASELAEAAAPADDFFIPEVHWDRSAKRVLTTSWVDAIPLTDIDAIEAAGIDRPKLATSLTRAFLTCAMDRGVFHADMHAGNLFADRDGHLWAVDFGIVGRIGRAERRFLALILHGFLTRDYKRAAEAHFAAGYVPARHSVDDFAAALRAVGEPIFGKRADEVPMSRVLLQLFEITDLFDMRLRPELVLLQKTMVQAEGVARTLDPRHNMWAAAAPVVETWMKRELGPEGMIQDAMEELRELHAALRKLPQALDDWAEAGARLRAGEVSLAPETLDRIDARRREGRIWRWIGVVLAAAAAGAAAAWVVSTTL